MKLSLFGAAATAILLLANGAFSSSSDEPIRPTQLSQARFEPLDGPQLKRLLSGLEEAEYPEEAGGDGSHAWSLTFQAGGTWEGYKTEGNEAQAYGNWRIENDLACVKTSGGYGYSDSTPVEGCFSIRVDRESGTIEATFRGQSGQRVVLQEAAYDAVERVWPAAAQPEPANQPQTARTAAEENARKALEEQRIALERERLAFERQRLEQEKRALALREQLEQKQRAAIDRAEPVIETEDRIDTVADSVTIAGAVRDDNRVIRVEVAGKKVLFDSGTGRFSTTVQVALGKSEVSVTALDSHGNEAVFLVSVNRKRDIPDISYGRYHALVIGIDDYKSLPKLKTALIDAKAVAEILETEYGYSVHLLENPTRTDIIDKLDELRETLVEDDNLLIYYAGHGWLDEQTDTRYWMPVDAKTNRRSRWVSNADLTVALQGLFAKHVIVAADSCYSGTLTRSVKVPERSGAYLERIAAKRTRVVLTSGGLEPVADSGGGKHSVFAAQFLKALTQNEGVMDRTKLFEQVRQTVVLNADQTPQYSDIRKAGHEGGDFLFVRRD